MKKRVISLLILLVMLLSLSPAAFAEGEGAQVGDIVYLGNWTGNPLRWTVLDPDATNAGDPGVFLITEQMLLNQGVVYNLGGKAVWKGSDAQKWCTDFYQKNLSALEQAAVPAVSKSEAAFQAFGLSWGEVALEEEKVFFLSTQEAVDYFDPQTGAPGLTATFIGDNKVLYYWLRTPHATHDNYSGYVIDANQVHDYMITGSWGARPAANLGGDGFVYLSPAERTLSASGFGPIQRPENGEWKVTAVDPALSLQVDSTNYLSGQLTVNYSSAPANSWISVLSRDAEGHNVAVANLAQTTGGSGSVTFTPELPEGGTLYLFAEVDNGAKNTNSSSPLCALTWTEEPIPTPTPEPTPAPETETEPGDDGGSISLVSVTPMPIDPNAGGLKNFLRQYWMYVIPAMLLVMIAIIVAIVRFFLVRREEEYDEYYYDEYEEEYEDDGEEYDGEGYEEEYDEDEKDPRDR